ncbi:hypothetical protein HK097_010698 [Rhizophlyctis rosea]|uniref:F-box domain-containing protein n=1 Tax=Rhizophlyctis rosea TaxID=64517 RepID=A0AAD5SAJ6_9FUNG|nr:hypothetical protein HK097_010698 [Rhizophlyctis rosea]
MAFDTTTPFAISLPTETILKILSYIGPKSLCRTERVCKRWNAIQSNDTRALWLPIACIVSEDSRAPYLLEGETYKDVYKIYELWETFTRDKLLWHTPNKARVVQLTGKMSILKDQRVLGIADASYPGRDRWNGAVMFGGYNLATINILLPRRLPNVLKSQVEKVVWQLANIHASRLIAARPWESDTVQLWNAHNLVRQFDGPTVMPERYINGVPHGALLFLIGLTFVAVDPVFDPTTGATVSVYDLSGAEKSLQNPNHSYTLPSEPLSLMYGISESSIAISAISLDSSEKHLLIKKLTTGENRCPPIPFTSTITSLIFSRTHLLVGSVFCADGITVTFISLSSYALISTINHFPGVTQNRIFDRFRLSENGMQLSFMTGCAYKKSTTERLHVLDVGKREGQVWEQVDGPDEKMRGFFCWFEGSGCKGGRGEDRCVWMRVC